MRKALLIGLILVICLAQAVGAAALEVKQTPATMESVIGLADKYTGWCEPKLEQKDKVAVAEVKKTIEDKEFSEIFLKQALDATITNLTVKLASAKSLNGLTVASAYLVKKFPKNRRALNLFGSVLHTYDKHKDAITVFRYTLTLDEENVLTRLNLANAYLDDDQDDKAKVLLDKLERDDAGNKAVFRALATYYYKKNNAAKFREYLFKAATFKGYKRKKAEKKQEQVEANEVKDAESTEAMESKLKQLETVVPMTTADILEEDFPVPARQIRDKYGKLQTDEKWILPKLPMVNLNGPPDFARNKPIVDAWAEETLKRLQVFPKRIAESMGVDPNASDDVKEAQAQAAGKQKMQEALQQAQQQLKYLESMPGIPQAQIAKAKAELARVMKEQNVTVEDKPVDPDAPPPGTDSGSIFAQENYYNYIIISNAYAKYFMKYYQEYNAKVTDVFRVYAQKVIEENNRWEEEWAQLQKQHEQAMKAENSPHHGVDEPCRRAQINHKKRLNMISDNYYRQWSNLYFPQYAQKMKPNLDAFYNVCMLHIRNMQDPKIIEQEYGKITIMYAMYAGQAIGGIGGGGGFAYYPETEEEERQLDQEVAKAREEAEAKKPEFERSYQSPEFSFTKWVDDHFVLEISGQFLALKVTSHSIEFEAAVPGVSAGAKYDFNDEKFETYTGVGMKLEVGMNVCGLGGKLEAGGEAYRRTATWDLKNGTYAETDTAKVEATAKLGPFLSAGGEFQVDTQLNAKVSSKVSLMGTTTIQGETTLN